MGTDVIDAAGVWALVTTLVLATAVGLVLRSRNGRLRTGGIAAGGWALAGASSSGSDRVLLLQLSSPVCSPCRQTAALLTEFSARRPGVVHREIDVAERPDVARELSVMRTPTVVAFGPDGSELLRVSGVPRLPELEAAIAPGLDGDPPA
ncbi:thioredoxin family protein [Pseudonocardia sp. CA-142604]|uniref:thioredoxin family protein n=1 Tax=Pseudonocardia sp. CA-142604 TaxID=3240024 RepID=UPI003D90D3BF